MNDCARLSDIDAAIELLPLPDSLKMPLVLDECIYDYARANVLHHTATQAAEIEALRSDVADYMRIANTEAARAERLAEGLRKVERLLSRTPKITRDIYVGRDRVAWGVQATRLLDEIRPFSVMPTDSDD